MRLSDNFMTQKIVYIDTFFALKDAIPRQQKKKEEGRKTVEAEKRRREKMHQRETERERQRETEGEKGGAHII